MKVVTLDKLYKTRILDTHIELLVHHIHALNVDVQLDEGAHALVGAITHCPEIRDYYSFASKFCHWHNRDAFHIYDSYVDKCLWAYQRQDGFNDFRRQDLKEYPNFVKAIRSFRRTYSLDSLSVKELDKFLWIHGKRTFGR